MVYKKIYCFDRLLWCIKAYSENSSYKIII